MFARPAPGLALQSCMTECGVDIHLGSCGIQASAVLRIVCGLGMRDGRGSDLLHRRLSFRPVNHRPASQLVCIAQTILVGCAQVKINIGGYRLVSCSW